MILAVTLTAEQWVALVGGGAIIVAGVVWILSRAFTVDDRYVHKKDFEKLEKKIEDFDTDFFRKKAGEKLDSRVSDLEKEVAHLPTDSAREAKLAEEFAKLARAIEAAQQYRKKP